MHMTSSFTRLGFPKGMKIPSEYFHALELDVDENHERFVSNVAKLRVLQQYVRRNFRYWIFKRWIRSKAFMEWVYHPNQIDGRWSKMLIQQSVAGKKRKRDIG